MSGEIAPNVSKHSVREYHLLFLSSVKYSKLPRFVDGLLVFHDAPILFACDSIQSISPALFTSYPAPVDIQRSPLGNVRMWGVQGTRCLECPKASSASGEGTRFFWRKDAQDGRREPGRLVGRLWVGGKVEGRIVLKLNSFVALIN